jgi:drug/metabolite transporter (DMT)-like permease
MLLFRTLVGTVGMSVRFYAMSNMVLTDATVIMFTSPIVTFLLVSALACREILTTHSQIPFFETDCNWQGALLLKEHIERADFVCALLSYIGVIFVARPAFLFPSDVESTKDTHPLAVVAALSGALIQAVVYICMRKLNDLDPLAMTHYLMIAATAFSATMMLATGEVGERTNRLATSLDTDVTTWW